MQYLLGKDFHRRAKDPVEWGFQHEDSRRCIRAAERFLSRPRHPGLNCKRLGSGANQNHWSLRASRELRVIIALDPDHISPRRIGLLNMGRDDEMYRWSGGRRHRTDLSEYGLVSDLPVQTLNGNSGVLRNMVLPRRKKPVAPLPGAFEQPFEEWTLYLPKHQRRLVNRRYDMGQGRIRGGAGTGKTVVALHRAVVLGRRYPGERILVTTFSRSLCNHMKTLFGRVPSPPTNVDFLNIDKLAYVFDKRRIHMPAVDQAFEVAYESAVPREEMASLDRRYMQDEVRRIIKGRGAYKEEYLDTGSFERLGRGRGFRKREREIAWRLRVAWDWEMKLRNTVDFPDRIVEARDQARILSSRRYRAAIVDEAQDMTQVGMEFILALVQGEPKVKLQTDSILILDDADHQRIYPGGWRPVWIGLDLRRRNSDVLKVNFRNTTRIFKAALAVRGKKDDRGKTGQPGSFERGRGERPVLAVTKRKEMQVILDEIRHLVDEMGFTHDEIGVIVLHNHYAEKLIASLRKRAMPCVNLKDLKSNTLGNGIRVGTFDRAKGMEFRAVFIPRLGASRFPLDQDGPKPGQIVMLGLSASVETEEEQSERNRDRLFVAMTRARDRLYLVADGQPFEGIQRARDLHFDEYHPGIR